MKVRLPAPLLALSALLGGCAIYTTKPIEVVVFDAESRAPVPGADVTVRYRETERARMNRPSDLTSRCDEHGRTVINVADFESGVLWEAAADGYLDHWAVAAPPARIPDEFRVGALGSSEARIALFRGPAPQAIVRLPTGFRGPLGVRLQPTPDWTPGERIFGFEAHENGLVELHAPVLLLRDMQWSRFRTIDADGRPVARERDLTGARDGEIALRHVTPVPGGSVWVVGTARDQAFVRVLLDPWRDRDGRYTRFDFVDWPQVVSRFRAGRGSPASGPP